jgi:hypothetical protein
MQGYLRSGGRSGQDAGRTACLLAGGVGQSSRSGAPSSCPCKWNSCARVSWPRTWPDRRSPTIRRFHFQERGNLAKTLDGSRKAFPAMVLNSPSTLPTGSRTWQSGKVLLPTDHTDQTSAACVYKTRKRNAIHARGPAVFRSDQETQRQRDPGRSGLDRLFVA